MAKFTVALQQMSVILDHCSTAGGVDDDCIQPNISDLILPGKQRLPDRSVGGRSLADMMRQRTTTMCLAAHHHLDTKAVQNADSAGVDVSGQAPAGRSRQEGQRA